MSVSKSRSTLTAMLGGTVLDYAERTTNLNITETVEANATVVVSGNPVTYDGTTTVTIEFDCASVRPPQVAAEVLAFWLFDGSTSLGRIGATQATTTIGQYEPKNLKRKLTPSAGSHTYSIRATVTSGTAQLLAGTGGVGNDVPAFIRITRESSVIGGTGIAGVQGGFAPLDSGLLIPAAYLPVGVGATKVAQLLGVTAYDPGSSGSYTTTSTLADVDATNALVTFTAPPSGNVYAKVSCQAYPTGNSDRSLVYGLREGSTALRSGQVKSEFDANAPVTRLEIGWQITGISAGSHTYKFAANHGTAAWTMRWGGGAAGFGPITIEVWGA